LKLRNWPERGSDGDVLLAPYVPKGITGDDDDDHHHHHHPYYHHHEVPVSIPGSTMVIFP
jgi:hypothetical protein